MKILKNNIKKSFLLRLNKGFSLMEVLVSVFVIMVLILGIYSLIILSLNITADNKSYVVAINIANQKMEFIRNLSYDDVGTITGSPVGVIPENEVIIRNGTFNVHTTITYYDDPYDGDFASGDPVWDDYKIATVEVSWQGKFKDKQVTMFSKVIPNTEEMSTGNGLIKIFVTDASTNPIENAEVYIKNSTYGIDVGPLFTNSSGILYYSTLPDFENYKIRVTKTNHGIDETHDRDAINLNPTKPHLTVALGAKTEENFSIDKLAIMQIRTVSNNLPTNWKVNSSLTDNDKINPKISIDSLDNTYFTWQDYKATSSTVYIQKYSQTEIKQWASDKTISTTNFQKNPDIVTTAAGNSFVVWQDDSATLKLITKNNNNFIIPNKNQYPTRIVFEKNNPLNYKNYTINIKPLFNIKKFVKQKYFKVFDIAINNFFNNAIKSAKAAGIITFVGAGPGATTGNSQTIQLTVPAGVQEGDFLLAYIYNDDNSDGPMVPPAGQGWNTLADNIKPSGGWWWQHDSRGAIFWKIAGASEPTSYTFTINGDNEQKAGHIRAYRGVNSTNPFDGSLLENYTSNGDLLRPAPSHTVSQDGSMLICGWGTDTRTLGENSPTFPSGMNNEINSFADYITAASADEPVNISDSPTEIRNYDANNNVSFYTVNWSLVLNPAVDTDDVTVTATGSQSSFILIPSANQYLGGNFVLTENNISSDITDIIISENGTVDAANDLSNIKLFYDLDNSIPYNCESETFNPGLDLQFGASQTFNGSDGNAIFTEASGININSSQTMCLYVVLDVNSNAEKDDTIEIEITNPSTDIILTSGNVIPIAPVPINGTTDLFKPTDLEQIHSRWRNDNGTENNATWLEAEDSPTMVAKEQNIRLRFEISNEGSIAATATIYSLEYGQKNTTCDAITTWIPLPNDDSQHWKINGSTYYENNATTSNIIGLTDENITFVSGYLLDEDNQTPAITLRDNEFTELEYAIAATNNATDSSYCFRLTNAGSTANFSYYSYPEAIIIGDDNIYIIALDNNANELWAIKKVNLDMSDAIQAYPRIALSENFGTATTVVTWQDNRNGNYDIYAQSIDSARNILWGSDLRITSSSTDEQTPVIAIDNNDNFIIAWIEITTNRNIFMQKFALDGSPIWPSPTIVANTINDEYEPEIAVDSSNNIYITWGENSSGINNIQLAKFNSNGFPQWQINPNIEDSSENQINPAITVRGADLLASWTDNREGNYDIYAQLYDINGNAQWSNDVRVNVNIGDSSQTNSSLVINSLNEFISVWSDNRDSEYNIYATKFDDPTVPTPLANVPLIITGTKQIGDNPIIFEYEKYYSTDASGELDLLVEWDPIGYSIDINPASTSLNIITRNPIQPMVILPEECKTMTIYLD